MPEPLATPPIRVAFVEDDLFFAEAFADALEGQPDMRLQAMAATCAEARAMLRTAAAEVLLVDLGLPDGSGLEIIREALRFWPRCHVMVSTVFGDETHVIQSLEAGATGYLLKDSTPERIINEIRSVHAGGSPISPLIARQLLIRFRHAFRAHSLPMPLLPGDASPDSPTDGQARLSPRERQVLEHIAKGFSYEEIGSLMGVSRNTVLSFVRRIYAKLKVRSQLEAIYEARAQGLLSP